MRCMLNQTIFRFLFCFLAAAALCAGSAAPGRAGPVSITDSTGHTATLKRLPERIAIAGKATILIQNAAFLFEDASEKVIALENRRQSAFRFLPLVDPNISEKAVFDVNAGPEQIAAVAPDLVLMKNFMAGQLGEPLKKLEIPVLYLDLETPEAFFKDIRTLGAVFGSPDRAREIRRFYQSRLEKIRRLTAGRPDKPDVLMLQYHAQGGERAFSVPPAAWMQTRLISLAGGRPLWQGLPMSRGWSIVTVEQIAAWDPDQVYIVDYQGKARAAVRALQKDPVWAELRAVQKSRLHAFAFDFYSWDQPDTRWILGLEWLAGRIHPELRKDIHMEDETRKFYRTLYRLRPETIEAEVLPKLKGNIW
jgi:iron complex transport system substrate-binding protein